MEFSEVVENSYLLLVVSHLVSSNQRLTEVNFKTKLGKNKRTKSLTMIVVFINSGGHQQYIHTCHIHIHGGTITPCDRLYKTHI